MTAKRPVGVYWAASCGGCEIAFVNLHEDLLAFDQACRLVFCPCLVDTKLKDLEAMPDGAIELTFFNGAIRTDDNAEMADLLRRKSRVLVAYGTCASAGGIPALSNLSSTGEHFDAIYRHSLSTENPAGVLPQARTPLAAGELRLPRFFERALPLAAVVDVDYTVPGCPPESHQVRAALDALLADSLPPRGSILGAGQSSVCAECPRPREDKKLQRLHRTFEIVPGAGCLLDQGIICMGVATRDGCGALCPQANMPCIGCYGPPDGVYDQGGKMAGALGSMLDIDPLKQQDRDSIAPTIDSVLDAIPDWNGTFYRCTLGSSLLSGVRRSGEPK